MGFRNAMVMGDVELVLKQCRMTEKHGNGPAIPVEDLDTVLIESRKSSVSTALLAALAKQGTALFVCNEKHMPSAVLLPFHQHSRQSEVMHAQLALTKPTQKRMWQQIVQAKIRNQALCMQLQTNEPAALYLNNTAKAVRSGDEGNTEATAAAYYFPRLFGKGFTRSDDNDTRNAALNYGYAVLRGCVARSLAVHGFLPAFGIHHRSMQNQFNLADDFIEPFRPLVDLFVARTVEKADEEFTPQLRRQLYNLVNYNLKLNNKLYSASYAIELTVQGLHALCLGRADKLNLPTLVELEQHGYE